MVGGGGGLGIGAVIILSLIGYAFGINPAVLIGGAEVLTGGRGGGQSYEQQDYQPPRQQQQQPTDQLSRFVSAILAGNEKVWSDILPQQKGVRFTPATLVEYSGATRSSCGRAESAMGPFYCPNDRKIYLDTSFFRDMQRKLGGGGDFAYAYVISHEMGHHIQNLIGLLPKTQEAQQAAASRGQANAISVRVELMADCLAGVWAANADRKWHILEQGDIEKAINTAQAIGDDRLQQGQGRVVPDSFTHGSSQQRVQWLQRGLQSGQIDSCNTFARSSG
ncbi:MAG: neutral zinc metallopeptidase [Beijerinckiaceae bacterium]